MTTAARAFLESLRPHQWIKNLLVFAGLVFGRELDQPEHVLQAVAAFVVFCMVSSGHYLVNDLVDLKRDLRHPEKRQRPIPSGRLSRRAAGTGAAALLLGGLVLAWFLGPPDLPIPFTAWPLVYLLLNFLYSFLCKHMVVLDVMCISLGFVIRVHGGAVVVGVTASHWLLLCTFFVALLLATCKRRAELALLGDASEHHRRSLRDYSIGFLDQLIAPLGAMTVFSYASYTVAPETMAKFGTDHRLVYTVPFVVFGIFRYLFLVHRHQGGGDPARVLLTDPPTLVNILLWFLASVLIVYSWG